MVRRLTFLVTATLAGCTAIGDRLPNSARPPAAAPVAARASEIGIYLDALRDLLEGDSVLQTDAFRDVTAAADAAPTTTNRLRLALALATPGHPGNDAQRAHELLSDVLASGDALLPEERVLALVHLKDVEQRLILDAEAERLQRAATAATAQRNDRNAQRLAAALEENRELRRALDEARAKLDAITNIERSIRERDNGADSK